MQNGNVCRTYGERLKIHHLQNYICGFYTAALCKWHWQKLHKVA